MLRSICVTSSIFLPLVDLFVASHVPDDDGPLTPELKHQLFHLTNYLVEQKGKRYRSITAIGRTVQSFSRVLQEGGTLELPELLPLEPYHYE